MSAAAKTITLSPQHLSNVLVALEDREDYLNKEIRVMEAAEWPLSTAALREDLAAVRQVIAELAK